MKTIFYKSKSCPFQAVWIQCLHPKKMPTQIPLDLTRILIQLQPCLGQHSLRKHGKTQKYPLVYHEVYSWPIMSHFIASTTVP